MVQKTDLRLDDTFENMKQRNQLQVYDATYWHSANDIESEGLSFLPSASFLQ